jgi:hypothetical protein
LGYISKNYQDLLVGFILPTFFTPEKNGPSNSWISVYETLDVMAQEIFRMRPCEPLSLIASQGRKRIMVKMVRMIKRTMMQKI